MKGTVLIVDDEENVLLTLATPHGLVEAAATRAAGGADEVGSVRLLVGDTGHGMDAATLQKAMDPFFSTKGLGKGTGLGLYISYGILEKHKGSIRLDTKYKNGTSFIVTLPAV